MWDGTRKLKVIGWRISTFLNLQRAGLTDCWDCSGWNRYFFHSQNQKRLILLHIDCWFQMDMIPLLQSNSLNSACSTILYYIVFLLTVHIYFNHLMFQFSAHYCLPMGEKSIIPYVVVMLEYVKPIFSLFCTRRAQQPILRRELRNPPPSAVSGLSTPGPFSAKLKQSVQI